MAIALQAADQALCPDTGAGAARAVVPRIEVFLSTYNGEAFLAEQLASLAAQLRVEWSLTWRDDGSTDASAAIMRRFADVYCYQVRQAPGDFDHLGTGASFRSLLAAAGDADLFAFCDQDDVWMPDKLDRAARALAGVPPSQPALYCSRQVLVDSGLNVLGLSPPRRRAPDFRNALTQNIASGCTIVLNRSARAVVLETLMPTGALHDWWSYLVVTGVGGSVLFDPQPSIFYRQHSDNAVGALASIMHRAWAALMRGPMPFMALLSQHLDGLGQCAELLTPDARNVITHCQGFRSRCFLKRLIALARACLRRQGFLEHMVFVAWVTAARLPSPPRNGRRYDFDPSRGSSRGFRSQ